MRKLMLLSMVAAATTGVTLSVPTPTLAQSTDRIIDIYGNDRCPASNGEQIVVCHKHPETERYRIPKTLRDQEPAPRALPGQAVAAMNSTGGTGVQINSCNAIGAGVSAGCFQKEADAWKAQKVADKKDEEGIP